jgi:hypothetical protein
MKTAIGWIAAITLVASTTQVRAENILLKCTEKGWYDKPIYLDINESRVIYNSRLDNSVDKSTIAIGQHSISFESKTDRLRIIWLIDRDTGQFSASSYLDGVPPDRPNTGSCEKDTRPSPKI